MIRRLSLPTALVCALATAAFAQDPTGTIEGTVSDTTAAALGGARVSVRNLDTGFMRDATTSADGFYRLLLLPVGRHSLTVEAPQFARLVQEPIQVSVSETVRVNASMTLPNVTETVTVAGQQRLVDATTNALGAVVTGRELGRMFAPSS